LDAEFVFAMVAFVPSRQRYQCNIWGVKIRTEEVGLVTILRLSGRLVFGEESYLQESVAALTSRANHILLDFADVSYIDSAGIGQLSALSRVVKSNHGSLKVLNVRAAVRDPLFLTRLTDQFEIFDDERHAINSFAWITCPTHGKSYPIDGKCPLCP
jgi:anti-anti-sigma factor